MNRPAKIPAILSFAILLFAGGCQLLYFAGGKGTADPLYKFPKNQHVLVLVDVHESVNAPPAFATTLADRIGSHLFRYKATDFLVSQDRIIDMQRNDPVRYKSLGVADMARETGADAVLRIYITQLVTPKSTDNMVGEGMAEVFVKVIDKQGNRIWPADSAGMKVSAAVRPALMSERDTDAILKELADLLTVRTGRMFHSYNLEDKTLTPR